MEELNQAATFLGLGGFLVVVGLLEVLKRTVDMTDAVAARVTPLASLGLGLAWNLLVLAVLSQEIRPVVVVYLGIFTGLAASGLYSGQKSVRGQ